MYIPQHQLLVSHRTDPHLSVFSLALAFSIHNKQPEPLNTWNNPHTEDFPLPPRGVLCSGKRKSRNHPRQGCSFTYQLKYWWGAYHFKNTYSPITLGNISSINLVSIFRCSSSPSNPVYVRSVDSSSLVFSLSSHRHSYIGLVFSSRFID